MKKKAIFMGICLTDIFCKFYKLPLAVDGKLTEKIVEP